MKVNEVDQMTLQEACDYAIGKLVQQGKTCMNENGLCFYGVCYEDSHCAVGWLLDHEDKELMNFDGAVEDLVEDNDNLPFLITDNVKAFEALQNVHDASNINRLDMAMKWLSKFIDIETDPDYQKWYAIKCKELTKPQGEAE